MAAKKTPAEPVITEEPIAEEVLEAAVPAVIEPPADDYMDAVYEEPPQVNPLIPVVAGLASAALTGLVFWLYSRYKRKKNAAAEEVIPFEGNDGGTTDEVPTVKETVTIKGNPQVHLEDDDSEESEPAE